MELLHCPYDASSIESEDCTFGGTVLSCSTCGAAWGRRGTWLQRIREPDPAVVRLARDDVPSQLVLGARAADVRETFRLVRSSISLLVGGSDQMGPTQT